jgi:hypothetical protein
MKKVKDQTGAYLKDHESDKGREKENLKKLEDVSLDA